MARKYYVNTPQVRGAFTRDDIRINVREQIPPVVVGPMKVYCECELAHGYDPYTYLIVYSETTQRLLLPRIQKRNTGRRFVRMNEYGQTITLDLNDLNYERGHYVPTQDETD